MQSINKRIKKDISNKNYSEEEKLILEYKDLFFDILNSSTFKEAEYIKNNLIEKKIMSCQRLFLKSFGILLFLTLKI